jgi:hypothetical protein
MATDEKDKPKKLTQFELREKVTALAVKAMRADYSNIKCIRVKSVIVNVKRNTVKVRNEFNRIFESTFDVSKDGDVSLRRLHKLEQHQWFLPKSRSWFVTAGESSSAPVTPGSKKFSGMR